MRLQQILLNLLGNAVKFTNRGTVRFIVELKSIDMIQAELKFIVEDTGIGMTEEQQERLFHPFMQADISTSRKYGGSGLGLTICHSLINLMGGTLKVESEQGRGSRFWFNLSFPLLDSQALHYQLCSSMFEYKFAVYAENPSLEQSLQRYISSFGFDVFPMKSRLHLEQWIYDEAGPKIVFVDAADWSHDLNRLREMMDGRRPLGVKWIMLYTVDQRENQPSPPFSDVDVIKPVSRLGLLRAITQLQQEESLKSDSYGSARLGHNADEASAGKLSKPDSHYWQPVRILVAEDQEINRIVIRELLQQRNVDVSMVENGIELLDKLQTMERQSIDMILMDIHMPEMDGLESARRIRSNPIWHDLPIIALTANSWHEDHERFLAAGMNAVMTKPVSEEQLDSILEKWKGMKSLRSLRSIKVEKAVEMLGGNYFIFQQVTHKFKLEYGSFCREMKQARHREDSAWMGLKVHALRGVAANLHAVNLMEKAIDLEQQVKGWTPQIDEAIDEVDREIQLLISEITW